MPLVPDDDNEEEQKDIVFEARSDNGRRLTSILASICVGTGRRAESSALAWCEVTDAGITVTVNMSKTLQAIAYVKRQSIFHKWWLAEQHQGELPREKLEFGINLVTLLECLKIFSSASPPSNTFERSQAALHMSFRHSNRCLCLQLNEKHSLTECEISSLEIDVPHRVELNLREGERPPARIVVGSDELKSGIDELEWAGDAGRDKRVLLRVTAPTHQQQAGLSLTISSTDVGCEIVYPTEALISFAAARDLEFEYRFEHLRMALRSLKESTQTMLQLDEYGTLEIKLRFEAGAKTKASELFSHFFLFPLAEEGDDDDPLTSTAADAFDGFA